MLLIVALIGVVVLIGFAVWMRHTEAKANKDEGDTRSKAEIAEDSRLPYRYADNRIFVYGNSVWTGVKLHAITDEQLSVEELREQVMGATVALESLPTTGDETPFMVRLTHRPIGTKEWAEDLIRHAWNPTAMYKAAVRRVADLLEVQQTTRPEVHLMVRIANCDAAGRGDIRRRLDEEISGVHEERITRDQIDTWHRLVDSVHSRIQTLRFEPMTKEDMLWLIRKPAHGHLQPHAIDFLPSRPWGGGEFQLAANIEGENSGRNYLKLIQPVRNPRTGVTRTEETYTCFLVAASWPDNERFTLDRAFLRYAARMPERVEVLMRGDLIAPPGFAKIAKKMRDDLNDELKDAEKVAAAPDNEEDMQLWLAQMKQLVTDQQRNPFPGMRVQTVIQLSAPNPDELDDLVRDVENRLELDLQRKFTRVNRYQWRLLQMMLPGDGPQDSIATVPFQRLQEADVFGFALPTTGTSVGDNPTTGHDGTVNGFVGDYIGYTNDGVPVHFSTPVGPSRNQGGGVASLGASGGGKTSLVLLKFFLESEAGVRCTAIDPKIDFAKFCLYLAFGPQVNDPRFDDELEQGTLGVPGKSAFTPINQAFWDDTEIVDVARAQDGALEPFSLVSSVPEGFLLAESVLSMFLNDKESDTMQLPVTRAIATTRKRYDSDLSAAATPAAREAVKLPSMWEISDAIIQQYHDAVAANAEYAERQAAEVAANIIETLRESPYARLVFSETPKPLKTTHARRTVFTLRGIELPPSRTPIHNWTRTHRLASTMIFLVCKISSRALEVKHETNPVTGRVGTQPKLQFSDESYVVTSMPAGQQMFQRNLAQGRGYGLVTWLIDQQAARLAHLEQEDGDGGTTGNQIHTVFAYKQKSMNEARSLLPLLMREGNDQTARALMPRDVVGGQLDTGIAMMRDADHRVAVVNIDMVFKELLAAAETSPDKRSDRQSVPLSPNVEDWSILGTQEIEEALADADEAEAEAQETGAGPGDDTDTADAVQDEPGHAGAQPSEGDPELVATSVAGGPAHSGGGK